MQNEVKQQITQKLREYCDRHESQNKAANSLQGVSSATVSQMLNENWDLIKPEMWRNVASQVGYKSKEWVYVETTDYKIINRLLQDAQANSNVFAMTGDAGSGKSKSFDMYVSNNKSAYLLSCAEYWNRKEFLVQLLTVMGVDYSGFTVAEMMNEIVKKLKSTQMPLIILDEADKLPDTVLYFFITLYNRLEDHCGIIMCATDHLSKRINKGIKLNRKGYKEINSRIGRKFIELKGVNYTDVMQICIANGIDANLTIEVESSKGKVKKNAIKHIFDDSENDLRRVCRKIHSIKNQK